MGKLLKKQRISEKKASSKKKKKRSPVSDRGAVLMFLDPDTEYERTGGSAEGVLMPV